MQSVEFVRNLEFVKVRKSSLSIFKEMEILIKFSKIINSYKQIYSNVTMIVVVLSVLLLVVR